MKIGSLAAFFGLLMPISVSAQMPSLPDKLCAVTLARQLPVIAGGVVTSFSFKPLDARRSLIRIVNTFIGLSDAARELDRLYPIIDYDLQQKLKNSYSSDDRMKNELIEKVMPRVSDGTEVSIDYQVAGIMITYAGACARSATGSVAAALEGAVR